MSLNTLSKEVHENAAAHGWWDKPPSFPEVIALCHSELSEALEEWRGGSDPDEMFDGCKGIPYELADCIIRILDYCAAAGIDIDRAVREKVEYNKSREYRHGGKRI